MTMPAMPADRPDRIAALLGNIHRKGVRLWLENGQLRYRAGKGDLTDSDLETLRASKRELTDLLERAALARGAEPSVGSRERSDRAPLSFSQLAHWHQYRLGERRSVRAVARGTRVQGRLDIEAFRKSIAEIVRRHDALRTRIVVHEGIPTQEIDEAGRWELVVGDLRRLPETQREIEVERWLEKFILEPVDVSVGPLFGLLLLRLREDEHVLILAMEHIISDEVSINIFSRELFTAYQQLVNGCALSLPEIGVQFPDYAVWQWNSHQSWIKRHGDDWNQRLKACQRVKFPESQSASSEAHTGWTTVPVEIGRELRNELHEWCRLRRTTVVMTVFAAYIALVLRWCDASEGVIQYQSDGRDSPNVENTIGYFATALFLRVRINEDDRFLDLMNRVLQEYCEAHERGDSAYFEVAQPQAEITRSLAFNWIPPGSKVDLSALERSEKAISCAPVPFVHPALKNLERDSDPSIVLRDSGEEIAGRIFFPRNRFSSDTMERFGRGLLLFVRTLLRDPDSRVKDVPLA